MHSFLSSIFGPSIIIDILELIYVPRTEIICTVIWLITCVSCLAKFDFAAFGGVMNCFVHRSILLSTDPPILLKVASVAGSPLQ